MNETIPITLTPDEALVLFERLSTLDKADSLPAEDSAEEKVFWSIIAQLEKVLVEPFHPKYDDLLAEAKARLKDDQETPNKTNA
jgi:hypothetical protein